MKRALALLTALLLFLSAPASLAAAAQTQGLFLVEELSPADSLRAISLPRESGEPGFLAVQGKRLLITGFSMEGDPLRLTLWDMETESTIAVTAPPPDMSEEAGFDTGLLADGRPFLLGGRSLFVYDAGLELRETYPLLEDERMGNAFLEPSGERLWSVSAHGLIRGRSLSGGEDMVLHMALDESQYFLGFHGLFAGELVFSIFKQGQGEQRFRFRPADGSLRAQPLMQGLDPLPRQDRSYALLGSLALFSLPGSGVDFYKIGSWRKNDGILGTAQGLVLAGNFDGPSPLMLYDLNSGLLVNELSVGRDAGYSFVSAALSRETGKAVLVSMGGGLDEARLLLWDYAGEPMSRDAGFTSLNAAALRLQNDTLAADIARNHGVRVYIREAGAAFRDDHYRGIAQTGELTTLQALENLREFLSLLPDGMLREMIAAPYDSLAFYLSGAIEQSGIEGIPLPDGFAGFQGSERYMALSGYSANSMGTLAHELMHIMEDRLQLLPPGNNGRTPLENFQSLSPANFSRGGYLYGYLDAGGLVFDSPDYTAYTGKRGQPVYYLDGYSRTFPLEDRARLFENLFLSRESPAWGLEHERVMLKARYLCHMLRLAFPSLARTRTAPWERFLSEDDMDWDASFAKGR